MFLKYRNKYSAGQQFTGEVTYGAAVSEQDCCICARGDGGGQLSLMGWLNHEPVVFVATARDRPAVILFLSLFTSVVRGLARDSYPRVIFCTKMGVGGQMGQMECSGHIPGGLHLSLPRRLTLPWSFGFR